MAANLPVLLVSTAARWYGAERMPRALAKAGFEVTLLTPRRSLARSVRLSQVRQRPVGLRRSTAMPVGCTVSDDPFASRRDIGRVALVTTIGAPHARR